MLIENSAGGGRMTLTRVSTPCSVFTRTLSLAMRLAAMDSLKKIRVRLIVLAGEKITYRSVTTEGRPSGTNATRMETAKVTQLAALPLYAVVIPTMKKTMAKTMAIVEIIITNWPLLYCQWIV